ncbi:HD-GYP domain-containing protein [Vogesella sp. XCS3]|nr:HD-GYP domain-containing protein [Vogesella sp. XCS3]
MKKHRIKKIQLSQLRTGMYIHDLNCGWTDHPFLSSRFLVANQAQIDQLQAHGIVELYIDTQKGLSVIDAPSQAEVARELDEEIEVILQGSLPVQPRTDLHSELPWAARLLDQANKIVSQMLQDARLGKPLQLAPLQELMPQLAGSVLRNATALSVLGKIKHRDDYTFCHSVSSGVLLMAFEYIRKGSYGGLEEYGLGGMIHDIGKMQIPPEILNKPGKLTAAEFEVMKRHVNYSGDMLATCPDLPVVAVDIAMQHHERFDGTGYPYGLAGTAISEAGRASAIVDVYDALTSERCYHKGMPAPAALRKIYEWSRHHFDPDLVRSFIKCIGIYPVGTLVSLESGKLGVVIDQNESDLTRPVVRAFFSSRRQCYIPPEVIDLSRSLGFGGGDRILRNEDASQWGMDPMRFLQI